MESTNQRTHLFRVSENESALHNLKKDPKDMNEVVKFKYVEKKQISHDTFIYTYEIEKGLCLGLNLGQHIAIDAKIPTKENPDGEMISRKYTPISYILDKGKFDLLIKVYYKNVHPQFPEGGKLTQWLNDLPLGSTIDVRGAFGKLQYLGDGHVKILKKFKPPTYLEKQFKKIGMFAGGSGITPFYQILQASATHKDVTEFFLIFGNKSSSDILLKDELDALSKSLNIKLKVLFTIDKPEEGWTGTVGFINKDMVSSIMPSPEEEPLMLMCGPPVMCQKCVTPLIKSMGYKEEYIFDF